MVEAMVSATHYHGVNPREVIAVPEIHRRRDRVSKKISKDGGRYALGHG